MSATTKTPDHQEEPSSTVAPEQNSDAQDTSPPADGGVEAQGPSPEMVPPIDPGTGEQAGAEPPPAPDAASGPDTAKKAKDRSKPKPKSAKTNKTNKTAGAAKPAAENPGNAGDGASKAAAGDGAPVLTCLQGVHIEPATSPPAGTLPPAIAKLFADAMSVAAVLAATGAASHGVRLDTGKNAYGEGGSLALRVAVVGETHALPGAIAPVLQAGYALEQDEVERWHADKEKADLQNATAAGRRRLLYQTLANAGLLGLAGLSDGLDPATMVASSALPRPRFLLRDPVQTEVKRALEAASGGILLVDGRRMPTMAGFGANYDLPTAQLLNDAGAGRALELADPRAAGCIRMRPVVASVIGTLATVDLFGLHKASSNALAATLFVTAEEKSMPHSADAVTVLTEILRRVRALAGAAQGSQPPLRLSGAARKVLNLAKLKAVHVATSMLPPLADYYAGAADVTARIAYLLHILDSAPSRADQMPGEVGEDAARRAIAYVEQCMLPSARSVLAPASVAPELRDARRIISFAQQYASAAFPLLARRDVVRLLQRSMPVTAVDYAIRRLVADGLLIASNPDAAKGGGHVFEVHEVVFEPEHQLPDLVTDPRRPR